MTTTPQTALQVPVAVPEATSGVPVARSPTELSPPEGEEAPLNFVATSPMKAPVQFQDPSATVKKRFAHCDSAHIVISLLEWHVHLLLIQGKSKAHLRDEIIKF